jgi:hypothetical protein
MRRALYLAIVLLTYLPCAARAQEYTFTGKSCYFSVAGMNRATSGERATGCMDKMSFDLQKKEWTDISSVSEYKKDQPVIHSHVTKMRSDSDSYHWRGLIWQSVEFNVLENGFRVAADPVMRDTLAHRPFWRNYAISMQHFNMGRWNDGDTFIVNYVGHAMHGAVAAYIAIQNSPRSSRLEWGDPGYGRSRFNGFLWATVYSTHSEISPAGEAGVGNEGGFTYGVDCQYHCNSSNFKPGDHYTNNTGWVDFVVSPTAGMLWVVAEDILDKKVSDRLTEKYPDRFWPKVVRGSLAPSRSFANMIRWRVPWYRDFQEPFANEERVHWFPSEEQEAWQKIPRLQLAPYFTGFTIATNTPTCFNCRSTATGVGLQGTAHIRDWLSFDSAVSYHANASPLPSDRAGGNMVVAVFGFRATRQWRYNAVHLALRPGFVRFSNAYLTSPKTIFVTSYPPGIATSGGTSNEPLGPGVVDASGSANRPELGPINHFVWNVNLSYDYRIAKHLGFRVGVDENIIRYRTDKEDAPGIGTPPYLSWFSKQNFINRGNYSLQLGPVFSF